jgi:molybdenum cofactor cytidylyltransferase
MPSPSAVTFDKLSSSNCNNQARRHLFVICSSDDRHVSFTFRFVSWAGTRQARPVQLTAILLAAGAGTRYLGATHKLLADLDGRTVVERSLDHLLAAAIVPPDRIVVISGAVELDLDGHPAVAAGARVVRHSSWADGQSSSLAAGLRLTDDSDAVIVGLGDQPSVPENAWRAVATADTTAKVVVATYSGRRGPHPVRLSKDVWPDLARTGDTGARTLLQSRPELVLEVACDGAPFDIDTLEDRARWKSS